MIFIVIPYGVFVTKKKNHIRPKQNEYVCLFVLYCAWLISHLPRIKMIFFFSCFFYEPGFRDQLPPKKKISVSMCVFHRLLSLLFSRMQIILCRRANNKTVLRMHVCTHMTKSRLSTAEKWIKIIKKTKGEEIMNLTWRERERETERAKETHQPNKPPTFNRAAKRNT